MRRSGKILRIWGKYSTQKCFKNNLNFSNLRVHQIPLEGFLGPTPRVSDSRGLGWRLMVCISYTFPGDVAVLIWVHTSLEEPASGFPWVSSLIPCPCALYPPCFLHKSLLPVHQTHHCFSLSSFGFEIFTPLRPQSQSAQSAHLASPWRSLPEPPRLA